MLELVQPADTPDEDKAQQQADKLARRWHARIRIEKEQHKDFRRDAKAAWDVYLSTSDTQETSYPLLWSVTNIQHSATYSSRPVPVVKPRNQSRQPAYKLASDVMERALEFSCDQTEFDENVHRVVDDYLVGGLGIPRVKLDAEIVDTELEGEDGEITTEPVIVSQAIRTEYVPWNTFGWEPVANFDHCDWVYFRHRMRKSEIKKRYGEDASFGATEDEYSSEDSKTNDSQSKYWVYEIWDKQNKQVIHLAEGGQAPLLVDEDPLRISGFFPCPPPIMTNVVYDRLVPVPDYNMIECFDQELNRLYRRAKNLTEQIKAITFHDSSIVELEDFSTIDDGESIAIDNIETRLANGDLNRLILPWPIKEKVEALQIVNQQIDIKRRQVDEMLGIGDVLRGASNPQDGQETNKIKERWGGIRLRRKQVAVQHMIRNLFRIMAEVAVEHLTYENLKRMTQVEFGPEVMDLLKDDMLREFAIDVETDSTVAKDEFQDKRERTELLSAMTQWVQVFAPAMNQNGISADLGREALAIAVQPYSNQARGLDQAIDQLPTTQKQLQQMQQLQGQLQQQGQQIQQMQYALAQYSQAEEQRKNQESMAKAAKDQATAAKTSAGLTDEQLQAGATMAETQHTQAQTAEIMRGLSKPDCGCDDCMANKPCGCGTNEGYQ